MHGVSVCSKLEVRPGLLLATTVCILRDTFRILDTLNFRYDYWVDFQSTVSITMPDP